MLSKLTPRARHADTAVERLQIEPATTISLPSWDECNPDDGSDIIAAYHSSKFGRIRGSARSRRALSTAARAVRIRVRLDAHHCEAKLRPPWTS